MISWIIRLPLCYINIEVEAGNDNSGVGHWVNGMEEEKKTTPECVEEIEGEDRHT